MTAMEIKKSIQLTVETVDDLPLLEAINTMLLARLDTKIVGYVGDRPLTKAGLIKGALDAEEDIKEGRVFTTDEVKQRLKLLSKK